MAAYTRELLAPYVEKIEAQAERIGRLENENDHLRAQLASARLSPAGEASSPAETRGAPTPTDPPAPRWWTRLGVWLSGAQSA